MKRGFNALGDGQSVGSSNSSFECRAIRLKKINIEIPLTTQENGTSHSQYSGMEDAET